MKADVLFVNGIIYTMKAEGDIISAFAVKDNRIIAAGTDEEIKSISVEHVVDLQGRTVIPGLADTHCHIGKAVEKRKKINLESATSMEDVIRLLNEGLSKVKQGEWLHGYQLNFLSLKEKRLPNRWDLDRVSENIPIFVSNVCGHNFITNTKGLELAGIDRNFNGPEREMIVFGTDGEPTGNLKEHGALKYLQKKMPPLFCDQVEKINALEDTLLDFSKYGFTTVHAYNGFPPGEFDIPQIYQKLEKERGLPIRVIFNNEPGKSREYELPKEGWREKIKYGAVKFFADGSFFGRSAFLSEDYSDKKGERGILIHEEEEFEKLISWEYKSGHDIAIHVIGDEAMEVVLNIIEKIYDSSRNQQFQLIHATLTTPKQWDRIAKYPNIVIDTQPIFLQAMGILGELRLGKERTEHLLAIKSWMDRGICVTGGSDAPICNHNPFVGIRHAVLREAQFDGETINASEGITVYNAVCMYTKNASFCSHEESEKGTLEVGKYADFAVLDKDIFQIDPRKIDKINVIDTYLGGKRVEKRKEVERWEH